MVRPLWVYLATFLTLSTRLSSVVVLKIQRRLTKSQAAEETEANIKNACQVDLLIDAKSLNSLVKNIGIRVRSTPNGTCQRRFVSSFEMCSRRTNLSLSSVIWIKVKSVFVWMLLTVIWFDWIWNCEILSEGIMNEIDTNCPLTHYTERLQRPFPTSPRRNFINFNETFLLSMNGDCNYCRPCSQAVMN